MNQNQKEKIKAERERESEIKSNSFTSLISLQIIQIEQNEECVVLPEHVDGGGDGGDGGSVSNHLDGGAIFFVQHELRSEPDSLR